MSQNGMLSCPACEYERGSPGRPVAAGAGRMRCLACGGEWREAGAEPAFAPAIAHDGRRTPEARTPALAGPKPRWRPGFAPADGLVWLSAGLAVFFLVAQPFSMNGAPALKSLLPWRAKPVEISSLSARQLVRDGQVAVRVEGRITNRTRNRQPIGDVDVVLTQGNGRQVFSWKHRPAVPWLEPGQSIRFTTANGNVPRTADKVEIRSAGVTAAAQL